jgi:transposase-like protein
MAGPCFPRKAIWGNGTPEKIGNDTNGANAAAIENLDGETEASAEMRQIEYLDNIVEQDRRAIDRQTQPTPVPDSSGPRPPVLPEPNRRT